MCSLNIGGKPLIRDSFIASNCYTHIGYSELLNCLERTLIDDHLKQSDKTIIHIITFIKNPLVRYLDEYQEIRTGITNKNIFTIISLVCNMYIL